MIKRNKLLLAFLHSVIPLLLGSLLYILFRSKSLIMFKWFTYLHINDSIDYIRFNMSNYKYLLPEWVYFSLPDGLWIYSFTSALLIYWSDNKRVGRYWLMIPFGLGILVEILQGFGLFQGTFDWNDLVISSISFLLSIVIMNKQLSNNEK